MGQVRRRRWVIVEFCAALVLGALAWALFSNGTPQSDGDWAPDHVVEARVTFEGESVRVDNVRDFRHSRGGAFEAAYRSETFDLADCCGLCCGFGYCSRVRVHGRVQHYRATRASVSDTPLVGVHSLGILGKQEMG
jgi:hypothetical protein